MLFLQVMRPLLLLWCAVAAFAQQPAPQPGVLPFELANNHLYVQVRVNESAPLWFIFDTGAGQTRLGMRSAKALQLGLGRTFQARGAGANLVSGAMLEATTLTLLTVADFAHPLRMALPLDQLDSIEGRRVDGVLGYDFIRRFVVEVDFDKRQLRLHEPQSFRYTGQGERLPLTFVSNHPHVRAHVEPVKGQVLEANFLVDLGARTALILTQPFVVRHKLVENAPQTLEALVGRGVGGDVHLLLTRLHSFRLGSFEFKHPLADLAQDTQGAFGAGARYEGNLGSEIMRRFRLFFDYERAQMMLEPNAQLTEAFEHDMSGMALEAEGAQFAHIKIARLSENSPSVQAGLQVGDWLESVDGQAAAKLGLSTLRQLFRQAGTRKLTFRRGTKTLPVRLNLKRRI